MREEKWLKGGLFPSFKKETIYLSKCSQKRTKVKRQGPTYSQPTGLTVDFSLNQSLRTSPPHILINQACFFGFLYFAVCTFCFWIMVKNVLWIWRAFEKCLQNTFCNPSSAWKYNHQNWLWVSFFFITFCLFNYYIIMCGKKPFYTVSFRYWFFHFIKIFASHVWNFLSLHNIL